MARKVAGHGLRLGDLLVRAAAAGDDRNGLRVLRKVVQRDVEPGGERRGGLAPAQGAAQHDHRVRAGLRGPGAVAGDAHGRRRKHREKRRVPAHEQPPEDPARARGKQRLHRFIKQADGQQRQAQDRRQRGAQVPAPGTRGERRVRDEQRADDEQSDAQVLSLPSALFNEGARRAVAGPQGLSRAAPALRMPPTMAKPQTGSSVP